MTSFEDFHRQRQRHALHYARAILGSDSAEDVCQEAWLRAWRAWGTAAPESLDGWLLTIVRNCCIDRIRSSRQATVVVRESDLDPVPPPEDAVVSALELASAWVLLQELTPPLREVLWLREVMDLTYAEIAEVQDVPIGTVMSRLHSARKKAVRLLGKRV
ncbi:MAG: sigma-70 family RNA polymerase sigma factor [Actinomycetota bacterium]|nr:sigma-70 family RNA polymerase sigma factor [Actinomycetota bacterium]